MSFFKVPNTSFWSASMHSLGFQFHNTAGGEPISMMIDKAGGRNNALEKLIFSCSLAAEMIFPCNWGVRKLGKLCKCCLGLILMRIKTSGLTTISSRWYRTSLLHWHYFIFVGASSWLWRSNKKRFLFRTRTSLFPYAVRRC